MNIWNASVCLAVLQMSKLFLCFLYSTCAFSCFTNERLQYEDSLLYIMKVRADVIPLCYSLGNWLIKIYIVRLKVVLDFSVKLFQVMKSSWLSSLKCCFCSCRVALKFWTCHRNSTLWPLVFRFLCPRNELVYCWFELKIGLSESFILLINIFENWRANDSSGLFL